MPALFLPYPLLPSPPRTLNCAILRDIARFLSYPLLPFPLLPTPAGIPSGRIRSARSLSNAVSSRFWENPSPNPLQIHPFRARIQAFLWEEHRPLSWTWEEFRRHHFLGFQTVPRTTLSEAAVPTWLPRNGKPPSPQAYFPWCKEHLRIPKTTNLGIPLLVTVPGRQKVYLSKEISVGPWEGTPRERFYPLETLRYTKPLGSN